MEVSDQFPAKPPSDPNPHKRHGAKLRLRELIAKIALPPLRGASVADPEAWSDKLIELKGRGLPLPPPDPVGHSLPSETLRQ